MKKTDKFTNEKDPKMKITLKMRMISNMKTKIKMTLKMKMT